MKYLQEFLFYKFPLVQHQTDEYHFDQYQIDLYLYVFLEDGFYDKNN